MPFRTRITEMLGIEHPVIMGGMTGVGTPELAAAVSNAGGLGIMPIHNAGSPEEGRTWIRKLRSLCNDNRPFGINLTILPSLEPPPPYQEYARVIIEEGVTIVETAGSNPKPFLKAFRTAGLITIHKCVSIRHALSAEKFGVDIISLDGIECAGHPGEEDMCAREASATASRWRRRWPWERTGSTAGHGSAPRKSATGPTDSFKQRMTKAKETDTVMMLRRLKNTCRVFRNDVASEVEQIEFQKGASFQFSDVAHLVNGKRGRQAVKDNDADGGIWSAGQVVGLIVTIPTCQQLMDEMMAEAEATISSRLVSMVLPPHSRL